MRQYSERMMKACLGVALALFGIFICLAISVCAAEINTEKILEDVEPENSFWLDNDTLVLKKYYENSGVYIIKFRKTVIVKKIEHTKYWLPIANPLRDTIIFKIFNDNYHSFPSVNGTTVLKNVFYAYNYRTGMLRKSFIASGEEKFFYDKKRNEMYFQREFHKYPNSLPVKCLMLSGFENEMQVKMATDGDRIYVLHPLDGVVGRLAGNAEERLMSMQKDDLKMFIYNIVSAKGEVLLFDGMNGKRQGMYSYSESKGLARRHDDLNGNLVDSYYAEYTDTLFVYTEIQDQYFSRMLYQVLKNGEMQPVVKSNVKWFYSVSPNGDKFLYFTILMVSTVSASRMPIYFTPGGSNYVQSESWISGRRGQGVFWRWFWVET